MSTKAQQNNLVLYLILIVSFPALTKAVKDTTTQQISTLVHLLENFIESLSQCMFQDIDSNHLITVSVHYFKF